MSSRRRLEGDVMILRAISLMPIVRTMTITVQRGGNPYFFMGLLYNVPNLHAMDAQAL